jgi:hypothetical protein
VVAQENILDFSWAVAVVDANRGIRIYGIETACTDTVVVVAAFKIRVPLLSKLCLTKTSTQYWAQYTGIGMQTSRLPKRLENEEDKSALFPFILLCSFCNRSLRFHKTCAHWKLSQWKSNRNTTISPSIDRYITASLLMSYRYFDCFLTLDVGIRYYFRSVTEQAASIKRCCDEKLTVGISTTSAKFWWNAGESLVRNIYLACNH